MPTPFNRFFGVYPAMSVMILQQPQKPHFQTEVAASMDEIISWGKYLVKASWGRLPTV